MDPDKLLAYNTRWSNYLQSLALDNNKINVRKAKKYFDSQFEEDWNNEAASREIDQVSAAAKTLANDLINKFRQDRLATSYVANQDVMALLRETLQAPIVTPRFNTNYWMSQASPYGFKSIDEVKLWQSQNGLVADGMFGLKSLAKWKELNPPSKENPSNSVTKPLQYNPADFSIKIPGVLNIYDIINSYTPTEKTPLSKVSSPNTVLATTARYTSGNTITNGDFGIGRGIAKGFLAFSNWLNNGGFYLKGGTLDLRHIKSFGDAFREARNLGATTFLWGNKGMVYGTKTQLDVWNETALLALGDLYQEGYNYKIINDGNTILLVIPEGEYYWNKTNNGWISAPKVNGKVAQPNKKQTKQSNKKSSMDAKKELGNLYIEGYNYEFPDASHAYTLDLVGNRYNYVKGDTGWIQVPTVRAYTKFLQGGTMNNQEELQKAFMSFLIEDAKAQGITILNELDLLNYAKQLGEEGVKAKYQEFLSLIQGLGIKALLGAKLNYYKRLKGVCPEGEELVYFKKGGTICSACLKMHKEVNTSNNKKMNAVEQFKKEKTMAKCGSKVSMNKCGAKTKKTSKKK